MIALAACSGGTSRGVPGPSPPGAASDGTSSTGGVGGEAGAPPAEGASSAGTGGALGGGGHGGGSGGHATSSSSTGSTGGSGGAGPCVPSKPVDTDPTAPAVLSATGLYQDIASYTLAPGVETFHPLQALWSDGATKYRFIELPECTQIDTSDMDHWSFPVGTKLWKEFRVGGARIETRLIKRFGPGEGDFLFAAYQWNESATEAAWVPDGVFDANGTTHDIPATWECGTCHGHSPERILGFGAVQLSHDGPGPTIETLSADGRLSVPHAKFVVPGDALTQSALGYLHANCGHCHNATPWGVWFTTPFVMRLSVDDAAVGDTGVYQTAVGVPPEGFVHIGITNRVAPGDPGASCVHYRMSVRGSTDQMPPFATEQVDAVGLATIDSWISTL